MMNLIFEKNTFHPIQQILLLFDFVAGKEFVLLLTHLTKNSEFRFKRFLDILGYHVQIPNFFSSIPNI